MTEIDLLKALFEAGGLALVSGLSIVLLLRSYREREKLLRQMIAQQEHHHKERLAMAEEKSAFVETTHADTLTTVSRLQDFMDAQKASTSTMMQELVGKAVAALTLNQAALDAVQETLGGTTEIMRRNTETWERLMTRVAS